MARQSNAHVYLVCKVTCKYPCLHVATLAFLVSPCDCKSSHHCILVHEDELQLHSASFFCQPLSGKAVSQPKIIICLVCRITFEHAAIRDAVPSGNASRSSMSDPSTNSAINQTFLPAHLMGRKAYHPRAPGLSHSAKHMAAKKYEQQLEARPTGVAPAAVKPAQEAYEAPFVKQKE